MEFNIICTSHGFEGEEETIFVAFQAKQQAVVEHGRMIDTIGVADQRVGQAAKLDETMPIGVVAGEA